MRFFSSLALSLRTRDFWLFNEGLLLFWLFFRGKIALVWNYFVWRFTREFQSKSMCLKCFDYFCAKQMKCAVLWTLFKRWIWWKSLTISGLSGKCFFKDSIGLAEYFLWNWVALSRRLRPINRFVSYIFIQAIKSLKNTFWFGISPWICYILFVFILIARLSSQFFFTFQDIVSFCGIGTCRKHSAEQTMRRRHRFDIF